MHLPRIDARFDEPLLERSESIGRLSALLAEARLGHGQIAAVTGEAGVGKSALLRAFEAEMPQDVEVLHGYCEDLSISEPLGPLRDLAREAGWDVLRLLSGQFDRLSVFFEFLSHLAAPGQVSVVVIEDIHWADEATLEFLRFIARRLRDLPVLLIATAVKMRPSVVRTCVGPLAGFRRPKLPASQSNPCRFMPSPPYRPRRARIRRRSFG